MGKGKDLVGTKEETEEARLMLNEWDERFGSESYMGYKRYKRNTKERTIIKKDPLLKLCYAH